MTTKYLSEPQVKRPYCISPYRAFADKRLSRTDQAVLAVLGYYVNRAGVCWPSFVSVGEGAGVSDSQAHRCVEKLISLGYARRLEPADDQQRGEWGPSNRYQVLWEGDEQVPPWEEIKRNGGFNPVLESAGTEEPGVQGEDEALIRALTHTHAALVEAAIGVRPSPSAERAEASRLAAAGLEPTAVRAATIDALAAARRGEGRWPLRLKDLALC